MIECIMLCRNCQFGCKIGQKVEFVKGFPPFWTYSTKSWSKFLVFQYIFTDNLFPQNILNIRDSLYIFLHAYICFWKEIIHRPEAKEDIDLKFYEWNMYFTPEIKQIAWMILDFKKRKSRGAAGIWSRDLPHRKQMLYHCTTGPFWNEIEKIKTIFILLLFLAPLGLCTWF